MPSLQLRNAKLVDDAKSVFHHKSGMSCCKRLCFTNAPGKYLRPMVSLPKNVLLTDRLLNF